MSASDEGREGRETATLAGGCFWCLEAVFRRMRGVDSVVSGYMGGHLDNPSYRDVCGGDTGHAEVVQVVFDPAQVRFEELLQVFFAIHDPTTLNRQGNDVGTQYRSAVFWHSEAQRATARAMVRQLAEAKAFPGAIVTEIVPAQRFWPAEDYHQDYFAQNAYQPYCQAVVAPKVAKFRKLFAERLKG